MVVQVDRLIVVDQLLRTDTPDPGAKIRRCSLNGNTVAVGQPDCTPEIAYLRGLLAHDRRLGWDNEHQVADDLIVGLGGYVDRTVVRLQPRSAAGTVARHERTPRTALLRLDAACFPHAGPVTLGAGDLGF